MSLVFLLVLFCSCEKDNITEAPANALVPTKGIRFIPNNSTTNRTSVVNGMLAFDDVATFLSTIETLANDAEAYDDDFVAKWNYLSDDDLEAKEIELGHNPDQPLVDFENQFSGFTSLRKTIEVQLDNLIKNETLNDTNDPDDHFIMDNEVRTVLNADAQVMIGHSLFQMTMFGYVEVTDGDFNTLALVASSDASTLNLPNVVISGGYYGSSSGNNTQTTPPGTPTDCRTDYYEINYKTTSSNRRIKGIQKLKGQNGIWGSKIKAKTKYQKKRWWGGWTSKRTTITATIDGQAFNQNCAQPSVPFKTKTKRKHKVKVTVTVPASANFWYKTKYHELKTIHKKDGNNNIIDDYFYE
ncbi:MAG: hypothetical protein R2812_03310 [Gelidibacter sp.]